MSVKIIPRSELSVMFMSKKPSGELFPIPTFPPFVTTNDVAPDDPIANDGPVIPLGLTDSCAHGVDDDRDSCDVKLLMFENVLKSASSVDEAAVPDDVSIHTRPDADVFSVPTVVVDSVSSPVVRFVVEAVVNDPYVVDDNANLFTPEKKLVSDSSVDEAAPDSEVRNPASLLNHDSRIDDEAIVCTSPFDPVYVNPCVRDGRYRLDENVDDAVENSPLVNPIVVDVEL